MSKPFELSLATVAELTDGTLLGGPPALVIGDVICDSRAAFADHSLFVAIDGQRFDGHRYLDQARAKGAAAALIDNPNFAPENPDDNSALAVILVDDTVAALQQLAAGWRARFDIPVVAITGSNGKTIVKDMLANILAQDRTVHRSPGSYNSQIGVPLSLLGIRAEHDVAVIEAGISRVGEMRRLESQIQPTMGVLTNIGLAHAAGLPDLETTARQKLQLFEHLGEHVDSHLDEPIHQKGVLVRPADCPPLDDPTMPAPGGMPVTFAVSADSAEPAADYAITAVEPTATGVTFTARFGPRDAPDTTIHTFALNVPGRHNLANAAAAMAVADRMGARVAAIQQGLAAFELSPLRLEMHTTRDGITLINDAYNSDPVSARAALGVLEDYAGDQRAVAIVGDMLDLGARSQQAHRRLGRVVAKTGVDRLICYGRRAAAIGEAAVDDGFDPAAMSQVQSMPALHELLEAELRAGDVVLFKASRTIGLERAAQRLLESVAPARLRVDLGAIRDNYHAIRRHLGDDTGLMAVVKSFGYGNDSTRVSQTLAREGVDALAVAYADEAIPLRRRGLNVPILVTNALASEADKLVKYELIPLVYSWDVVDALCTQARRFGRRVPVHLEIDTGMNRVGLQPDDAVEFGRRVRAADELEIRGVMTHFAAADDPAEDAFTDRQIAIFGGVVDDLRAAGIDPPMVHAANTAGAWRFPAARFDCVRVGLGLYGLAPSSAVADRADGVRPALSFSTRILHLHPVDAGETVGYNRSWTADRRCQIATIAAGYNDGLPRFMSNGGPVLIGRTRCPIVGKVCMDVAMVDVTGVDDVGVGDEVVIFGRQGDAAISVDEIADRGDTIHYEILCNIAPRVRRIFVRQ